MDEIQIFGADPQESSFEEHAHQNDFTFWLASDLMKFLGYDKMSSFRKPISKAQAACANLDIPVEQNFIAITDNEGHSNTKLTRFACYLVAMNADPQKPQVAKAQVYFVTMAESFRLYLQEAENVQRIQIRGEIKEREKSLTGVANQAGVEFYGLFQNAGYRGMYNMNISQLRAFKRIPDDRSPLDYMGKTELAANLFRITQTEEKIKSEDITGQRNCENAAEFVGREVRKTMKKLSGNEPENLPLSDDIKVVRKEIKQTHKKFKRLDNKPSING